MQSVKAEIKEVRNLIKSNNIGEARLRCEKIVLNNPNNIEANYLMGIIYTSMKSFIRAEEYFEKTLLLDPNYYDSLVQLSLICERNGERERASVYRERSFRIAHKNV